MPVLFLCGVILLLLLSIETGRRIAVRRQARIGKAAAKSAVAVESSIYALMGLLVAFTFYGAAGRFESRRQLIVKEANALGTTYLRVDLLPSEMQPQIRHLFRRYLRSRLEAYQKIPDVQAFKAALADSSALQKTLWVHAVAATRNTGPATQTLFLNSLNEAIDITTDRTVALTTHPPAGVYMLLAMSVIASAILAGYSIAISGNRSNLFKAIYAIVLGTALFVTMDYEYPRFGLIRIDPVDRVLADILNETE